jgi:uncharacterized protein
MRARLAALLLGLPFGFTIAWTGMADPEVIRRMMLLEDWYLYKVFAAGMVVGLAGSLLLRRLGARTLVGRRPIEWEGARPERRHVAGSVVFGCGWAIAASCPGPIATQLSSGLWWSGFTIVGIGAGILLWFARQDALAARAASPPAAVSR